MKNLEYNCSNMCLLSKRIIFPCPNYFNVVCVMKRLLDLYNLELFEWTSGVEKFKRTLSNLNRAKYLRLSSVICFFEIGGKTESQVSIPDCAVVISRMEINNMGPRFTKEIEIRYFLVKEDHQRKRKK